MRPLAYMQNLVFSAWFESISQYEYFDMKQRIGIMTCIADEVVLHGYFTW